MKGQIKIEFIFGILFFGILIFYLATQINTVVTSVATDSRIDSLKAEAKSVMKILLEDPGEPDNWNKVSIDEIKRMGLMNQTIKKVFYLSKEKIDFLNSNCELMNITISNRGYKLTIYKNGQLLLDCGYGGPIIKSLVEKSVFIENEYGKVILELW